MTWLELGAAPDSRVRLRLCAALYASSTRTALGPLRPPGVARMLLSRGRHVAETLDLLRGEVDADYLGDFCGWQLLVCSEEGGPPFAAIRLNSDLRRPNDPPAVLLIVDNP